MAEVKTVLVYQSSLSECGSKFVSGSMGALGILYFCEFKTYEESFWNLRGWVSVYWCVSCDDLLFYSDCYVVPHRHSIPRAAHARSQTLRESQYVK